MVGNMVCDIIGDMVCDIVGDIVCDIDLDVTEMHVADFLHLQYFYYYVVHDSASNWDEYWSIFCSHFNLPHI